VVAEPAAYGVCLRLAREHYENFPVASRLLPRAMRPHVAAIYAFARTADDFADEGSRTDATRLALLDDWRRRLHDAATTTGSGDRPAADVKTADLTSTAIFVALAATIRDCRLDPALFDDLLSAFRQDVLVKRYDTWASLLDYCRRSANPIGRLVLAVAGYREARVLSMSDAICTGLQITNFCQDLERDWKNGRLYVPAEITGLHGAREAQLDERPLAASWRETMSDVGARTRALFDQGRPLVNEIRGRLGWELRATWLGGVRVLERLERSRFDVFSSRPALGWRDGAPLAWRLMTWR
jgi:squalene synthase HpnC